MTSIHDSFAFIKKIAELRTIEEACAEATDDDSVLEINQEYKHSLEDEVSGFILAARALVKDHPYDYVDFSGAAIREHYENVGNGGEIEDLIDQDLQDAGEWALNNPQLWDDIYEAWDYGVECVRSDQQKKETS